MTIASKIKNLKNHQGFMRYFKNTSWLMGERILRMAVGLFVGIWVARYLGPEQFGFFSYAISLVSIFAIAGHAGLSGLVVRELVKYPETRDEIMGTSFFLKGAGYCIGGGLLFIFIFLTEGDKNDEFWVLTILTLTLLFLPFNVIDFWLQSRLEAKYKVLSNVLALLISSVLKLGLVFLSADLIFFAIANLIQTSVIALVLVFFYRYKSKLSIGKWRFSLSRAKELISQGWVVFLGSIFAMIYLKIDQIMLKWLVSSEEVGIYAVAVTLSEAWYFVPVAIVTSFLPKLIKLKETDLCLYQRRFQQLYDLLFMLAFGVAITVSFFAEPTVNFIFGDAYQAAVPVLVIHIWAGVFIFMRAAFSKWMLIENVLIFSLVTQGLGALVNVALNYWLIPMYGGIGAAYATLASYATSSYLALLLYPKTRDVFWVMTRSMMSPLRYTVFRLFKMRY